MKDTMLWPGKIPNGETLPYVVPKPKPSLDNLDKKINLSYHNNLLKVPAPFIERMRVPISNKSIYFQGKSDWGDFLIATQDGNPGWSILDKNGVHYNGQPESAWDKIFTFDNLNLAYSVFNISEDDNKNYIFTKSGELAFGSPLSKHFHNIVEIKDRHYAFLISGDRNEHVDEFGFRYDNQEEVVAIADIARGVPPASFPNIQYTYRNIMSFMTNNGDSGNAINAVVESFQILIGKIKLKAEEDTLEPALDKAMSVLTDYIMNRPEYFLEMRWAA